MNTLPRDKSLPLIDGPAEKAETLLEVNILFPLLTEKKSQQHFVYRACVINAPYCGIFIQNRKSL